MILSTYKKCSSSGCMEMLLDYTTSRQPEAILVMCDAKGESWCSNFTAVRT